MIMTVVTTFAVVVMVFVIMMVIIVIMMIVIAAGSIFVHMLIGLIFSVFAMLMMGVSCSSEIEKQNDKQYQQDNATQEHHELNPGGNEHNHGPFPARPAHIGGDVHPGHDGAIAKGHDERKKPFHEFTISLHG
jgi:Ca2+/Na+ antiporter